jgi:HK97 family phage prohead protease
MRKITKLFISKAQSIDQKAMTAKFKISDAQTDRMGEIVDQKSWDFKNYMENPLLLWGHDPSQPEYVLGQTLSLAYDEKEDATYAEVRFDTDINPKAELIFNQVARGTLRAVSVGMIVHSEDSEKDTTILKDCELLEISVVPIPANPRAIALAFTEGSISSKDARFMAESMEKELKLLSKELNNDTKETVMNKVKKIAEQVKDATSNVTASSDLSDDDSKFLQGVLANLAEIDSHIDAADELIDQAQADLAAFLGVENPDPADDDDDDSSDDEAEDEGDEETAPQKSFKKPAKKDLANGGSDDQSGADDKDGDEDSIDEDTELTEEQQKAFEAEFEKSLAEMQVTK